MTPDQKQAHTKQVMQQYSFKPAAGEWISGLHKAQVMAKSIQRHKGIPDKYGGTKFFVAPAEDFTGEGRRCLLNDDVNMGWFRVTTMVSELNPHSGTLKLTGCYVVYHEPSSQAQVFYCEWTARTDGDAMASAHTRLTRRFIQGLLQIAVVDEGIVPEDPPNGCQHPRERHVINADTSVVCTLCGEQLGYAPPPSNGAPPPAPPAQAPMFPQGQQAAPQTQAPAPQAQAPAPQQAPVPQAPVPQQAPAPQAQAPQPPVPQQAPAPAPAPAPVNHQAQYAPPIAQPTGPVAQEPIVAHAQAVLEAEKISPQQMRNEQAERVEAPANPATGDPTSPEAWRDILTKNGMDEDNAIQCAMLDDNLVIEPAMVEDMRNWAWSNYKGDVAAITAAWIESGFQPVPSLPLDQRPRPTGIQAKRFLTKMTFKTKTASAAQ
jgi:hypothetical protein